MIKYDFINSSSDGLKIELAYTIPKEEIKGIVQFSHGMAEHKERYFNFMEYLSNNGYVCVINDHRGHGNSVKDKKDLGYFYTEDTNFIIDDLHDVTKYIKEKYSNQKELLEQLQNMDENGILDLSDLENQRIENIAKELNIEPEDIYSIDEIDLEQLIDEKYSELNSERENQEELLEKGSSAKKGIGVADDDEWKSEIISWWDEKLPIVMSVDGGYSFYAIDLSNRINFCH